MIWGSGRPGVAVWEGVSRRRQAWEGGSWEGGSPDAEDTMVGKSVVFAFG